MVQSEKASLRARDRHRIIDDINLKRSNNLN